MSAFCSVSVFLFSKDNRLKVFQYFMVSGPLQKLLPQEDISLDIYAAYHDVPRRMRT